MRRGNGRFWSMSMGGEVPWGWVQYGSGETEQDEATRE